MPAALQQDDLRAAFAQLDRCREPGESSSDDDDAFRHLTCYHRVATAHGTGHRVATARGTDHRSLPLTVLITGRRISSRCARGALSKLVSQPDRHSDLQPALLGHGDAISVYVELN